ncbi:penicillin-binding protein 1B [Pseudidiomarina donghaiensis]|uniref:penicillin-binding protein 1B n=1 Tax=Pseudidiomarina donghaiensis TaxID=519452 RepID=UPI003A9720E3
MSKKQSAKQQKPSWWRRAIVLSLKLALIGLIVLVGYVIYLDATLTDRFSSNRYQAPALIYGRSLVVEPQASLTRATLIHELKQLNYAAVQRVDDTGQYRVTQFGVEFYRRPFDFATGPQMAQRVQVNFAGDQVQSVQSLPDGRALNRIQLEPPYLGRLSGGSQEDRLLIGLERVPSLLIETLILVEDRDFYHHAGVSVTAIARAALANLSAMRTVQGGSTLTQQLIKNLYLTRDRSLWRKANEALMALVIDYRFSKNEILETYLNEVYFGQDRGSAIHGVGLASRLYFGKQVEELEPAEIALLVGIVKGPSYYDPRRYPERAQERRDLILQLMLAQNLISQKQYVAAVEAPVMGSTSGRLVSDNMPHFMELVKFELGQMRLPENWQQDGLRVFTYFDPAMQRAAESALTGELPKISQDAELQGAVVVANHQQAGVTAVVGDRNPRQVGFNRAVAAMRPVGSLIKPLIYAEAFEANNEYELGSLVVDEPLTLEQPGQVAWQPQNFDKKYKGPMLAYDALAQSRNVPAVRLGLHVGIDRLAAVLQQSGVDTPIPEVPAVTLGAVALSPVNIAEIYSMLAQQGTYRPLRSIRAVTNHQGLTLYQREFKTDVEVFSKSAAYLVNFGLRGVINEGTGSRLADRFGINKLAGKSGTTNDYRDSWFVAYDNQHVFTVWLGRDDNQPVQLTGSSGALRVVEQVLQRTPIAPLQLHQPVGIEAAGFHPNKGVRIPVDCRNSRLLPAREKQLPENLGCSGDIEEKSWWQRLF